MTKLKKYKKRLSFAITAIQLNLETEGFSYQKWGAEQNCKQGDWIVDNGGDFYTIDNEVFKATYVKISKCQYVKNTLVFAEESLSAGTIKTKEGISNYDQGSYLVYTSKDHIDAYVLSKEKFELMYEPFGE